MVAATEAAEAAVTEAATAIAVVMAAVVAVDTEVTEEVVTTIIATGGRLLLTIAVVEVEEGGIIGPDLDLTLLVSIGF